MNTRISSLFIALALSVKGFIKIISPNVYPRRLKQLNSNIPDKVLVIFDHGDAVSKLNRWESYISNKKQSYYPKVSTEAIVLGRQFIRSRETPYVMEWCHMVPALKTDLASEVFYYKERYYKNMTSHLCLGEMSIPKKKYFIRGIVENPENVLYEFSIHGFLHRLQTNAYKSSSPVRIDISKLKDWCHGIYHFSLTRSFEKKS